MNSMDTYHYTAANFIYLQFCDIYYKSYKLYRRKLTQPINSNKEIKMRDFWDTAPCSLGVHQRHQGDDGGSMHL